MKIQDRIIALFEADYAAAKEWFSGEALPFLENLLKTIEEDAVVALRPFAEQALANVVADAGALLTGAGWAAVMPLAITQMETLIKDAGKSLESIAGADLHAALGAAAANLQAKA